MKILQYFGVVALLLLIAIALVVLPNRIESRLIQQTRNTLIEHNLTWVEPSLDGQDLTIRGTPPSFEEKQRAEAILQTIPGIRIIHSHFGEPAPTGAQAGISRPRVATNPFFPQDRQPAGAMGNAAQPISPRTEPSSGEKATTTVSGQQASLQEASGGTNAATELVPAKLTVTKRCGLTLRQVFRGETIQFRMNTSRVRPTSRKLLQRLARAVKKNCNNVNLTIAGYTDSLGSAEVNLKLSEARAVAIRDFLVKKGVEKKRISTVGYGESKPIADNKTRAGRIRNRRIEIYPGG